jgi:hypothetical protein
MDKLLTRLLVLKTFVLTSTTALEADAPILLDPTQWLAPDPPCQGLKNQNTY